MARRKVTRGAPPQLARSSRSRSRTASPPRARTAVRRGSGDEDDEPNFLGQYFREMAELDVMSPQEELESAMRIARLREDYWRALLAYPLLVDGIVALIESSIEAEDVPTAELVEIRRVARRIRERESKANRDAYVTASNALAERMAELDVDAIVSDLVAADLNSLDAQQWHGLNMPITAPIELTSTFPAYVHRVRSSGSGLRVSKNAFVKANLRLVVSIARRFNHGRMPLQDLIQEGNIGLMKAVDRFDYRKGFRFSTYGSWWIRHAISRAVADKGREVRLPVHMIDAYHKVTKARRDLEMRFGKEPTNSELAEQTGIAETKIEKMGGLLLEQPVSLDRPVSGEDGRRMVDFLEDPEAETDMEHLEADALNDQVRQLIAHLRPIEADILRKRFGLVDESELTLKEIGVQYSLSRERIRQLQEQALGKIRRELKRKELM